LKEELTEITLYHQLDKQVSKYWL